MWTTIIMNKEELSYMRGAACDTVLDGANVMYEPNCSFPFKITLNFLFFPLTV